MNETDDQECLSARAERWKKLCRDSDWLQGDRFVAPAGYQLNFSFMGVATAASGEGLATPGFFISSDIARTSIKNAPSGATSTEDFIIAKPEKGYNVSVWTYFLWDDLVCVQLQKIDADRVM